MRPRSKQRSLARERSPRFLGCPGKSGHMYKNNLISSASLFRSGSTLYEQQHGRDDLLGGYEEQLEERSGFV